MANVDNPDGFRVHHSCKPLGKYALLAGLNETLYVGDVVKKASSSDPTGMYQSIQKAGAGVAILGVIVGFEPLEGVAVGSENLNKMHHTASTAQFAYVCDDPHAEFEVQASGTTIATDCGLNIDLTGSSGSTVTGRSNMEVDTTTINTTSTLQFQVMRHLNRPDNAIGANGRYVVIPNNHQLNSVGTTGV